MSEVGNGDRDALAHLNRRDVLRQKRSATLAAAATHLTCQCRSELAFGDWIALD